MNGKAAGMETVIGHNDLICHLVHRHEPPVTARPLTIIHSDQELLVIDKPASIPVRNVVVVLLLLLLLLLIAFVVAADCRC